MLTKAVRPFVQLAVKPSSPAISALSKSFTTSAPRLESENTNPKPRIIQEKGRFARGDRPTRRLIPISVTPPIDHTEISYWDPTKNLSLDEAIDRNIHFLHPVQMYNSKGDIIGVKRNNIIRARASDIVDPETGDHYTVTLSVERFHTRTELNYGWQPDRHTEMDKTAEQRKKEENEREELRQAIVGRRLALWDSELKDPESSSLLKTVRQSVNAVYNELESHVNNKPEPVDKEFGDLVEKAKQLRLEHLRTLEEIQAKVNEKKKLLADKYRELEEATSRKENVDKIKAEIERIKGIPIERATDRYVNQHQARAKPRK